MYTHIYTEKEKGEGRRDGGREGKEAGPEMEADTPRSARERLVRRT